MDVKHGRGDRDAQHDARAAATTVLILDKMYLEDPLWMHEPQKQRSNIEFSGRAHRQDGQWRQSEVRNTGRVDEQVRDWEQTDGSTKEEEKA